MKTALFSAISASKGESIEKFATDCAEMGFDGMELAAVRTHLSPLTYKTKASRKKLKEFIESKGLEICDIDQRSGLSIPNRDIREHELVVFQILCEMAVDLDCPIVKVDQCGLTQHADPNIDWGQQRAWLVECLKDCAEIAEDYGVKCGLHNHVVTTVRENLEMINEVGSKSLGLIIDADNATVLHEDVPETVRMAGKDKILLSHIKDHRREIGYVPIKGVYFGHFPVEIRRYCRPGDGIVDNVGFMKALKSIGWDGYFSLEAMTREDTVFGLDWMKKTWKRL